MKLIKSLYIIAVALYYYVITGYERFYGREREIFVLVIVYGVFSLIEVLFKNFKVERKGAK